MTTVSGVTATTAHGEQVDLERLWDDPWPILKKLRDDEPVSWVPAADRYLVTRHHDVTEVEQNPETYVACEKGSLIYRVMGHPFMRKDGEEHKRERRACDKPLKPGAIKKHWMAVFRDNTDRMLDGLAQRDGSADLVHDFFGQLAARNLAWTIGFTSEDDERPADYFDERLQKWSKAMMDATANYRDIPEIWAKAEDAVAHIDEEISRTMARVMKSPDHSVISSAVNGEHEISEQALRAAIKVMIGGGINEPRDAMATACYALFTQPDIRARVEADDTLWRNVFEEAIRWVSPISMYPKMVARETELNGVKLKPGDKIGVCVGSANRDDRVFDNPDQFSIDRTVKNHHAFGAGAHFCAGAWVARASVSQIALPELFRRFPGLRLKPGAQPRAGGWVFRGMLELPVVW